MEIATVHLDGRLLTEFLRACRQADRRWPDQEPSAASVYLALLPRLQQNLPAAHDKLALVSIASWREAVRFHMRLERDSLKLKFLRLRERNLSIEPPRGNYSAGQHRVHCTEFQRFGLGPEISDEDSQAILASFRAMDQASQSLVGAALRLPGYTRMAELARRYNLSRQRIHQKATARLLKWKRSLRPLTRG